MKKVKYVLAIFLIVGGVGIISQGSFISGFFATLLGILILPKIGEKLKESIGLWNKKIIRYVSYFVLFILIGTTHNLPESKSFTSNQNNKTKKSKNVQFKKYRKQTEKNIRKLTKDKKKSRGQVISDLKKTKAYKVLVTDKIVSTRYLPLLTSINNGVRYIAIDSKGNEVFSINENLIGGLSQDETTFIVKSIVLATPNKGGFTNELLDVFARYKKKYKLFGGNEKSYDINGKLQEEINVYNISALFYLIQPNEGNYNAIYDANKKGISSWFSKSNTKYIKPYFAYKQNYLNFAKKEYPKNPYIMKVDIEVSAKKLHTAYDENEVAADERYKDKKLGVTGVVGDIGKDILGDPYVSLKVGYLQSINCYFDDNNNKVISKLRKGQKITVIGKCKGKSLTFVVLKDCELWNE